MLKSANEVMTILNQYGHDPMLILHAFGGRYICPKDANGKRLGPLVGYAGRYDQGTERLQYVGDIYANWAVVEEYPVALLHLAERWRSKVRAENSPFDTVDVFFGAPEGGKAFAELLALIHHRVYMFPEKEVTALRTKESREKSKLVFGRHSLPSKCLVMIVEDVTNNFSTTDEMIQLILDAGSRPIGIATLLNRSPHHPQFYKTKDNDKMPILALHQEAYPEYQQDDPGVADDVQRGNVIWKPKGKEEWAKLMAAMDQHTTA